MKRALMKAMPHAVIPIFGIILLVIIPRQVASFSNTGITTRSFPRLVAWIFIVAGTMNTFFEYRNALKEDGAGDFLKKRKNTAGLLRAAGAVGAAVLWLLLLKTIGFPIMTVLLCAILMFLAGNRSVWQMVVISLVSTAVLWYVFKVLLYTPLPAGILPL